MDFIAKWEVRGQVMGHRILTSKTSDWKAYVVRVAVIGATLELMCEPDEYERIADGDVIECMGRHEARPGSGYSLVMEQFRKAAPKAVA